MEPRRSFCWASPLDTGQRYGMPRFCCGGFNPGGPYPPTAAPGGGPNGGPGDGGSNGGDPVDTATGFLYVTKRDLTLPGGIVPLAVTRTYRANLNNAGPFGVGSPLAPARPSGARRASDRPA
jgi:hypothetical protein